VKFYLVLDFETSGLLHEGAQPVELGAVLLDKKSLATLSEFQAYIRHDAERFTWSDEAEATHELSRETLEEHGVPMSDAWSAFVDWIGSWVNLEARGEVMFCGHNLAFDLRFLQLMAGVDPLEEPLPPWACVTTRDTMQWAALVNQATIDGVGFHAAPFKDDETGFPSVSLENVAKSLGLPTEGAHSALFDARMTAQVMAVILSNLAGDLENSRKWEKRQAAISSRKVKP